MLVYCHFTSLSNQQRVTVGCRGRHRMRANRPAGTRAIFDHDRLAKSGTELVRNRARNNIARAACGIGNDQLDGPAWIGLAPALPQNDRIHRDGDKPNGQRTSCTHDRSSFFRPRVVLVSLYGLLEPRSWARCRQCRRALNLNLFPPSHEAVLHLLAVLRLPSLLRQQLFFADDWQWAFGNPVSALLGPGVLATVSGHGSMDYRLKYPRHIPNCSGGRRHHLGGFDLLACPQNTITDRRRERTD